ncbi:MAG: DsbC family protein [Pseudomonadota bacterium]
MHELVLALLLTTAAADELEQVRAVAAGLFPDANPADVAVRPSALPDFYEVSLGTRVVYLSADGEFLVDGPLYSLTSQQNLTALRQTEVRRELVRDAPKVSSIVYPAKTASAAEVTVVTNINCTFCRQLHAQLDDYAAAGIALRYVMLPSAGPQHYQTTAALLCAADPAEAVTNVMLNRTPPAPAPACEHNLDDHVALAGQLGAVSTPNLILPNGELIQGYQTPAQLRERLGH